MYIDVVPHPDRSCCRLGKPWPEAVAARRVGLLPPNFAWGLAVFGRAFAGAAFPPGGKA